MAVAIRAVFDRIEEAENAASKLKSLTGINKFTITKRTYHKDVASPFVLPYPPVYGLDDDILRPRGYGYDTHSGYFEPALSDKCELRFTTENKNEVTSILRNSGASEISAVSVIV